MKCIWSCCEVAVKLQVSVKNVSDIGQKKSLRSMRSVEMDKTNHSWLIDVGTGLIDVGTGLIDVGTGLATGKLYSCAQFQDTRCRLRQHQRA